MSEIRIQDDFARVKKLIDKEKKQSLELFRRSNFHSRLQKKISPESQKKRYFPFWQNYPVPALVILSLVICVGVITLVRVFSPSPNEKSVKIFEAVLSQAAALQRIFNEEKVVSESDSEFFNFEWALKRVLFSLHRRNIPDEDVPFLVYKVLCSVDPAREDTWIFQKKIDPGLFHLEKELECLRDQDCRHQFYSQIIERLKEVYNVT